MDNVKFEVVPDSLLLEVFEKYPDLESKIIELIPAFKSLTNPVLRSNIIKVTTLKQAAAIGKIPLGEFINKLRKTVNLDQFSLSDKINHEGDNNPEWLKPENIKVTYDAIEDLANGLHPVGKVMQETAALNAGEIYLLITNFVPMPLIQKGEAAGLKVFNKELEKNKFGTYFCK